MSNYFLIYSAPTFTISKHNTKEEYWLYDKQAGINIAMNAKSKDDAFTEAIVYYQRQYKSLKEESRRIKAYINTFVNKCNVEGFIDLDEE